MTASAAPVTAPPVAPDPDHPVRSFVTTLIAIGVLLLAIQVSGAVQPRLTTYGNGRGERETNVFAAVVIRNDGALPVRIESVEWPSTGGQNITIGLLPEGVDVAGRPSPSTPASPVRPFTLSSGERRVIVITATPTCAGSFSAGALRLRAHGVTGFDRNVEMANTDPGSPAVCP